VNVWKSNNQVSILLTDTILAPVPWDGRYRSLQLQLWMRLPCPPLPSFWPPDTWDYNRNLSTMDPCTKVANSTFFIKRFHRFSLIFAIYDITFFFIESKIYHHSDIIISFVIGEVNQGYVNEAQSVAGSRKSLSLRPVLLVAPPEQDRYSELSRAKSHSHHSLYTPAPSHPVHTMSTNTLNHSQHNFQLWDNLSTCDTSIK